MKHVQGRVGDSLVQSGYDVISEVGSWSSLSGPEGKVLDKIPAYSRVLMGHF